MKVLWFSPISAGLKYNPASHNGGGWISSLKELLVKQQDIQLGIAFEGDGLWGEDNNGVRLFPISSGAKFVGRLKKKLSPGCDSEILLPEMKRAISDFSPDVIHIWGSENAFFSLCRHTKIPCVTHLQGFLPSYFNAKYPPGVTKRDVIHYIGWHPLRRFRHWYFEKVFANRAVREAANFQYCPYFMGRTEWDRSIVEVYNPEARYFHCDELLRNEFYSGKWSLPERRSRFEIVSIISSPLYKGHDVILKTAKMLKEHTAIPFGWKVYGIADLNFWERHLSINAEENQVKCCGTASAQVLKEALLNADLYIHPSYIDNSPNSLCEAQILGVPVVATNVGGIPSLVKHGETGLLVPANDPVMLAARIKQLFEDAGLRAYLGDQAFLVAHERHDPEAIKKRLLNIYRQILQDRH